MKGINAHLKNLNKVVCLVCLIFLGQKAFSQSNVTVNATSTTNGAWSGTTVGPYTFTPSAANSTIINTDIQQRLLGTGGFTAGNVTIVTTCGACGQAGNVTISNPITAATTIASRTFTITAAGSISVNAAINFTTATSGTAAPGSNISLTSTGSSISIAAAITTAGGNSTTVSTAGATGGSVTLSANTSVSVTAAITTDGGDGTNVNANGGAGGAVSITSTTSTTSSAAGSISTTGGTAVGIGTGGAGGSVTIAAGTNARIAGAITSTGGAGTNVNANGGNGSAISITGTTGITFTANLAADGGAKFGAGTVGSGGNYLFNDGAATITTGGGVNDGQTAGVISGSGTVTKNGSGAFNMDGVNTYTGKTTISAGTISANTLKSVSGGSSSLGSPTTVANGTIDIGATGVLQYTGVAQTSDRVVNLTGSGGSIDASGTGLLTLSGGVTGNTHSLVLTGTGTGDMSGVIGTTTGGMTKNGSGTWTLSGTNTYTGITTINAGVVSVGTINNGGAAGNLGQATAVATNLVLGGGTLQYTGGSASTNRAFALTAGTTSSIEVTTVGTTLTISGAIGNGTNGALTKTGTGTLSLTGSNTYTGGTFISGGTLSLGASGVFSNTGKVTLNGGTLSTLTFAESMGILALTDSSTIDLGPSSTLNFADSHLEPWTAGKKITINGWLGTFTTLNPTTSSATGSKIFVGTLVSGLTAGQVAQIQFFNAGNYYPAKILSTGEIVPNCIGTVVTSASSGSVTSGVANNVNYNITGGSNTWSRAAVTGISNAARTGQTSDPIIETLTNTTTSAINVTYVITTPASGGCAAGTFNYVVSVNPVNSATCPSVPAAPTQPACATFTNLNSPGATTLVSGTSYGFCGTSFTTGNVDGGASVAPIYILSGQTLTVTGNINTAANIYVFAGATLNLTGDFNTLNSKLFVYGTLNHATSGTSNVQGNPSTVYIAPGAVYNGGNLQMNSGGTIINEGTMNISTFGQLQGSAKMCIHNSGCLSFNSMSSNTISTQIITFGGSVGYMYSKATTCPSENNDITTSSDLQICSEVPLSGGTAGSTSSPCTRFGPAQVLYGCTPSSNNCQGAIALPITLTFFKPTLTNEGVVVKWGTNSQWDSKYFIIEKSKNGIDWEYVNELPSHNGKYRYEEFSITDPYPYEGDSYYRLVEVDYNGKRTVYSTDFIHNDKKFAGFSIYPNPSNGSFVVSINGDSPQYQLNLFDALGNNIGIYTLLAGKNEIRTRLSSGMYLAKLKVGHHYFTQKIVVK